MECHLGDVPGEAPPSSYPPRCGVPAGWRGRDSVGRLVEQTFVALGVLVYTVLILGALWGTFVVWSGASSWMLLEERFEWLTH